MKKMGRPLSLDTKEKISISLSSQALKILDKTADKFSGGMRSTALELILKDWQRRVQGERVKLD